MNIDKPAFNIGDIVKIQIDGIYAAGVIMQIKDRRVDNGFAYSSRNDLGNFNFIIQILYCDSAKYKKGSFEDFCYLWLSLFQKCPEYLK